MKKMLKRLINNKGTTLTELIVVLFISSVILAIAMGMLAPVRNLMNTMKSNAHMDTVCATGNEYIRATVQTAKTLSFVRLGDNNAISAENEEKLKKAVGDSGKAKVLALLDVNAGTGEPAMYRLFDFSDGITYNQLKSYTYTTTDYKALIKEYGVFRDPFYENTSYAMEFYNSTKGWLQIASQCYRNGEAVNQKHILNFKLLNSLLTNNNMGGVQGSGAVIEGSGADDMIDIDANTTPTIEGHAYIIVYS